MTLSPSENDGGCVSDDRSAELLANPAALAELGIAVLKKSLRRISNMPFKHPVSVLVVIYAQDSKRVLMLQRRDDRFLAVGNRQHGKQGKPRCRPLCVK